MSGFAFNSVILILGLAAVILIIMVLLVWSRRRRESDDESESGEQRLIREQIIWRALAQGGKITVAEAAAHGGQAPFDVERALMALVAEGKARAEAGEEGDIVYYIDSDSGTT